MSTMFLDTVTLNYVTVTILVSNFKNEARDLTYKKK